MVRSSILVDNLGFEFVIFGFNQTLSSSVGSRFKIARFGNFQAHFKPKLSLPLWSGKFILVIFTVVIPEIGVL